MYEKMVVEVDDDAPVILYFHGGVFWYFSVIN